MGWFQSRGRSRRDRKGNRWQHTRQGKREICWKVTKTHNMSPSLTFFLSPSCCSSTVETVSESWDGLGLEMRSLLKECRQRRAESGRKQDWMSWFETRQRFIDYWFPAWNYCQSRCRLVRSDCTIRLFVLESVCICFAKQYFPPKVVVW